MSNGVYRAVSGSLAQLRQLDVLSNNLAHVDTPGYKGDRVRFREALDAAGGKTGYVDTPESATSLTAGPMTRTDNPLDLALNGDGFFVVETQAGERLTRAGRFLVGGDGTLRTVAGHAVQGMAGPIQIPIVPEGDGSIDIRSDGQIFMNDRPLAKLKQVKATTNQIRKVDDQLFAVPDGVASLPVSNAEVMKGHLEQSNVNPVLIMTQLVSVQRSFETLQEAVRTYREMDQMSQRRLR